MIRPFARPTITRPWNSIFLLVRARPVTSPRCHIHLGGLGRNRAQKRAWRCQRRRVRLKGRLLTRAGESPRPSLFFSSISPLGFLHSERRVQVDFMSIVVLVQGGNETGANAFRRPVVQRRRSHGVNGPVRG